MVSIKNHLKALAALALLTSTDKTYGSWMMWSSEEACVPKKQECNEEKCYARSVVESKIGYFFFSDSKMRKIYNRGGVDVQISGSFSVWESLQIYGSVEYFKKYGQSLGGHQRTDVWELPLSLGIKQVFKVAYPIDYYFTIGPRFFIVHVHMDSSYVTSHLSGNGLGGFVNTGFNFFPNEHFVVDVFAEYSYKQMSFHSSVTNSYGNKVNVGGFVIGLGIGYAF